MYNYSFTSTTHNVTCTAKLPFNRLELSKDTVKSISITSIAGLFGIRGEANYLASKSGIIGFTKVIAKELAKYGTNINYVASDLIDADFLRKTLTKRLEEVVNNP